MNRVEIAVGWGDYPVRGWRGWRPHLALVMMAMRFILEERLLHHQPRPLLSGADSRALLNQVLPRRDTTGDEVIRQMERPHRKRQAAIDSTYHRQQLNEYQAKMRIVDAVRSSTYGLNGGKPLIGSLPCKPRSIFIIPPPFIFFIIFWA